MRGSVRIGWPRMVLLALAAVMLGRFSAAATAAHDRFRKLAPGVETTIPPDRQPDETHSAHDVVEIHTYPNLEWTPHFTPSDQTLFSRSAGTRFRHSLWCLEFSFKPLRMVHVDIPQPSGKMQRKLIRYLVYRVKNTGSRLVPSQDDETALTPEQTALPIRFQPQLVLASHEFDKAYLDRIIPAAMGPIQQREDPRRTLQIGRAHV